MTLAEQLAVKAAQNNNQRVREDILEKYGHVRHENAEIKRRDQIIMAVLRERRKKYRDLTMPSISKSNGWKATAE